MYVCIWAYVCRYSCTMCRGQRIISGVFLSCSPPYLLWDKISLHPELTTHQTTGILPFLPLMCWMWKADAVLGEGALLTWVWPAQGGQCLRLESMERPHSGQGMNVQERLTIRWESKCKRLPLQLLPLQDDIVPLQSPYQYQVTQPLTGCHTTLCIRATGASPPEHMAQWIQTYVPGICLYCLLSQSGSQDPGVQASANGITSKLCMWVHGSKFGFPWLYGKYFTKRAWRLEFFKIMIFVSNLRRVANHIRRRPVIQGFTIALIFKMSLNIIP